MSTGAKPSPWVTVNPSGNVCAISSPPAPTTASPAAPPMQVSHARPTPPPLPPWQIAIGTLGDAIAQLELAPRGDQRFRWSELATVDDFQIAVLQCVLEGIDASADLDPVEELRNPFTGKVQRLTVLNRVHGSIECIFGAELVTMDKVGEMVADGVQPEGAVVFRVPPRLVAAIAPMTESTIRETARAWARAWSAVIGSERRDAKGLSEEQALVDLRALVAAAKTAVAERQDVFLWTPG